MKKIENYAAAKYKTWHYNDIKLLTGQIGSWEK